jgi:drug/metabolite transporter (DMT)-like permease
MSAYVAVLVLLSALMHAGWNVLVKHSQDGQLDTVSFALAGSALAALMLPFVPLPEMTCAPWMATSLLVHVGYFISLIEAYRHADLSVAYPLMRGMAPVLVTALTLLLGEQVTLWQGVGIGLIGLGIALPVWISEGWRTESRKGILFGCLNAAIIALYTSLDGMGVRQAETAIGYTFWMFFFNGWGILAYTVWTSGCLGACSRALAPILDRSGVEYRCLRHCALGNDNSTHFIRGCLERSLGGVCCGDGNLVVTRAHGTAEDSWSLLGWDGRDAD